MKKIVLSLCLILLGASVLSGCTKDEVLDQYNNIVQSAGSIALTGNLSLQGTKEKGIDDYTGSYTADYEDFSDTEYLENPHSWLYSFLYNHQFLFLSYLVRMNFR